MISMVDMKKGYEVGDGGWCQLICDAPETYLIRVPFPNVTTNSTNCYLVRDGGDSLLIDTGAPSDDSHDALSEALRSLNVEIGRMAVFLTHLHLDHAGLVERICTPETPLYASKADYDLMRASTTAEYRALMRSQVAAEGVLSEELKNYARYGLGYESFDSTGFDLRLVGEGDVIRVGSLALHVIDTAGHTAGHLSLFEPSSGLFFGGDHVLFVLSPVLGVRPGVGHTMETYLRNLKKMGGMGISMLLHSHGPLRDDWEERVEWLIEHHERRLANTAALIAEKPGMTGEEAIRGMGWNVRTSLDEAPLPLRWCILESGIVVLDCLVERGEVRRAPGVDGINRYY